MSWESKTDYCGLASGENATYIQIKASNKNASSQYLEKLGQHGDIRARKLYGDKNAQPSCEYVIKKAGDIIIQIGKVTTVDGERFALQQVVYTTGAGSEPTLTATSVRIEDTTDGEDRMFEEIELHVNPEETAQTLLFWRGESDEDKVVPVIQVTGAGNEVTGSTCTISGTVSPHNVNGDPVASGVHSGKIEVALTVGQYGETAPTFSIPNDDAAGMDNFVDIYDESDPPLFEISQQKSPNDPDSDMPEWSVQATVPLRICPPDSGSGSGS